MAPVIISSPGVDALDRGDFVEIDDADLAGYLQRLATAPEPTAR